MRVLFSVSGYPPSLGGCEYMCQQYAERLADRGHTVEVVAPDLLYSADFYTLNGGGFKKSPLDRTSSVLVHRTYFVSSAEAKAFNAVVVAAVIGAAQLFLEKAFLWLVTRRYYFRLYRTLKKARPEIIIVCVHLNPNVAVSLRMARSAGVPALYLPLLHEEDSSWPMEGIKKCVAQSDGLLALTHNEARTLAARYAAPASRVFVTGIGVDLPEVPKSDVPDDDIPTILYLGRKTAGKGLFLLADALQLLKERKLRFNLALIGGDADDTPQIERRFSTLLGDRLISRTNVSDAEKEEWLGKCTVMAFPSDRESFGIVILEAWSSRKPVVTINTPVAAEIISNGSDGTLVPPNDPLAFADALAAFVLSPAIARQFGECGYLKAKNKFSWDICIDAIENAMRTVTSAQKTD